MGTESSEARRKAGRAAMGRAYGLYVLAAVGAALCVGISHSNPAAMGAGAVLMVLSVSAVTRVEARMRAMDPARRTRLASRAGFAGLAVALVFPFVLPPEWSILLVVPAVGGLIALGRIMMRRGRAALRPEPAE